MFIKTAADPLDRRTVEGLLDLDEITAESVVDFAEAAARETDRRNDALVGRDVAYHAFVNGRPVDAVTSGLLAAEQRQPVVVQYEWDTSAGAGLLGDALRWIAAELVAGAPVVSGEFRDSILLFGDERLIGRATDLRAAPAFPEARRFVFVATAPYSRKIEVGMTEAGRPFVVQVPPRLFERVAAAAASRFGNAAAVRPQWTTDAALPAPTRYAGRSLRYPAIVVTGR